MTSNASGAGAARPYRERLIPSIGFFVALLLVIPAAALVMLPIVSGAAIPVSIAIYLIAAVTMYLLSPVLSIDRGRLTAGRASIPVDMLGEVRTLGQDELREAIGPGIDARSYLLLRGWIRRGVQIENIDPADPAPQWIITTRHPGKVADLIRAQQG